MKSLATLIGWIAIGAITTIAGQQVWKQFQKDNPERSEQLSQNVKQTIHKSAETVKKTAQAVAAKTDPEPEITDSTKTEDVIAEAASPAPEKQEPPVSPSLGEAEALAPVTAEKTVADTREEQITERFYKLAEDRSQPAQPVVELKTESAEAYEKRQNSVSRQEDVLMDRQMRIVDELAGE